MPARPAAHRTTRRLCPADRGSRRIPARFEILERHTRDCAYGQSHRPTRSTHAPSSIRIPDLVDETQRARMARDGYWDPQGYGAPPMNSQQQMYVARERGGDGAADVSTRRASPGTRRRELMYDDRRDGARQKRQIRHLRQPPL